MSDSEDNYDEEVAAIDRVYVANDDIPVYPRAMAKAAAYLPNVYPMPVYAPPMGFRRAKPAAKAAARENYKERIAREANERRVHYDVFPKLLVVCDEQTWKVTIGMVFNHADIRRLTPPELFDNEGYTGRKINWVSMHRWIRGNTSMILSLDIDDDHNSGRNWITQGEMSEIARSYALRRRRSNDYIAPCHIAMFNNPDIAVLEYVVRIIGGCRMRGDGREIWPINPDTVDELRAIISSFGCSESAAAAAGVAMTDEPTDIIGRD